MILKVADVEMHDQITPAEKAPAIQAPVFGAGRT